MKRKTNKKLMLLALILVLLSFAICILGSSMDSIFIKTKDTPSANIKSLFESFIAGNGAECTNYTDSYKKIILASTEENETVQTLCDALIKHYSYEQSAPAENETSSLVSTNTVSFSTIDLEKLSQDITEKFDSFILDVTKTYDSSKKITTADHKYIPEVYEKAYFKAVSELLKDPSAYTSTQQLEVSSSYNAKAGHWEAQISKKLASMLLGGISEYTSSDTLSLPAAISDYVEDSIATLSGDSSKITHHYSLPYSTTVGPKPDAACYTSIPVEEAANVENIIAQARACGLLGEQTTIFNAEAEFYPEDIVCYFDNSILVICWKEYINGCVCNCMEVKIADGSQLKRKLTGDAFNSGILDTVSNMSAASNAVAAINGDYYAYRDLGISIYQSKLYRYQLSCEVLMINDKGNFIFYYPDGKSAEELQTYVDEEKIQFSLAFGPVLIDNYQPRAYKKGYAYNLGEMTQCYSRAAFGEYDDLHYLFMTSGYSDTTTPPANLNAFTEILQTKNLKNAYNVDGGQTAEMAIQNTPYNHIDYGGERQVSDMVFFATAIQESTND